MIIQPVLEQHQVVDYEIVFNNGLTAPITVDEQAGDTVDWATSPLTVTFYQAERPHPVDPEARIPAEETTIFISHILTITKRRRTVMPATPDQKAEWQNVLRTLSTSRTLQ